MRRPLAIDLFSGAGGFTTGLLWAGFEVAAAVEVDKRAAATYRHNHPTVALLEKDIREATVTEVLRRARRAASEIVAIVAGAPCQGFSESNRRSRTMANEANKLYRDFVRFVHGIRPRAFVFENVLGIKTVEDGAVIKRITRATRQLGYDVTVF